ncbi:MAG: aspartyl/asparaginyl beta-hydroxylase domain-containing protein, partial [Myxococcales bacterium]|nr:aspartyl/asparaginyl beta-hydroxylase domain-containing protein [Myxococcales bacterium]
HRGGIRCLRLLSAAPRALEALRREVEALRGRARPSRVADAEHVTHWVGARGEVLQYSLLNASGRTDDYARDHEPTCRGKWFFDAASLPTLGRLIGDFPHLINFRVNVLGPGALLPPHEEHVPFRTQAGGVGARVRFHLPVKTEPEAELDLDGDVVHLEAGTIHLVNHGCVHAAWNRGTRDRIHLVWDALLTREVFALISGRAALPPDWEPVPPARRVVEAVRHEALGPHRRLTAQVSAAQAAALDLCDEQ